MRKSIRLVVLACAGALALVYAGGAFATQRLEISQARYALNGTAPLDVIVTQAEADAAPAKVVFLIPVGYQITLGQAAGAQIGTVDALAKATLAGTQLNLPLSGPIVAARPADYAATALRCTGVAIHQAVWILQLTAAGQTLAVPVYVDKTTTGGNAGAMQVCLPSPYIPESAGGARFGAQLLSATLHLDGVLTNPADPNYYLWQMLTTPYVVGTGTPNRPGTVESRARVPYPYVLSLKRMKSKRKRIVVLGGKLSDATGGVPRARVRIQDVTRPSKPKAAGSARTSARGTFTRPLRASKALRFFQAVFGPLDITSSACTAPVIAPGGCVSATQSGVKSGRVRVARAKRR